MAAITAAGVLPRASYNGSDYYYFGVDKKNEITTFCGKKNNGETNRACAAREFGEESLGAITSKKKISKILQKFTNVTRIENSAVKQITYIARVQISKKNKNPMARFQKRLKKPGLKAHQKEIKKIVAINRNHLRNLLQSGNHFHNKSRFRGDTWGTLCLALNNNQL